jgi:hypothetical protein
MNVSSHIRQSEWPSATNKSFNMNNRVAYVSTPGAGHVSVLASRWKVDPESHLFIVRYRNWPEYVSDSERMTEITLNRDAPSEVASIFNEDRSKALMGELKVRIVDFLPTLIVYDFFCLEARTIARDLGIPAICSIPATLKPDETETCSDGILPKENMYWVWRTWYEVAISPVQFMGPRPLSDMVRYHVERKWQRWIIISLGTVISESNTHLARVKLFLNDLQLVITSLHETTNFLCVGMSKFKDLIGDGAFFKDGDLQDYMHLVRPVLLIFHGGGNTFSEAIAERVPVLVCPFFGDQFETARQAGSTYEPGNGDMEMHMENAIKRGPLPITATTVVYDDFSAQFKNGDLVFGHRRHRDALQKSFPMHNLHLNHYASFASFANPHNGELPAIADVYNDETEQPTDTTEYGRRLTQIRDEPRKYSHMPEEHRLVHYCIDIMMLTVKQWKNRIHFVLGEEIGPATSIELNFVKENWDNLKDSIIFYNVCGQRIPAPFFRGTKVRIVCNPTPPIMLRPDRYFTSMIPFMSGRIKSNASIVEKEQVRRIPVYDMLAYRTGYLNQEALKEMITVAPDYTVRVRTCGQRVHYYYWHKDLVEVQLWPWVYLHYFYQNMAGIPSSREFQRLMQDKIEEK